MRHMQRLWGLSSAATDALPAAAAPPRRRLFVVLHLYVLMQLYLLARLLRLFDEQLPSVSQYRASHALIAQPG